MLIQPILLNRWECWTISKQDKKQIIMAKEDNMDLKTTESKKQWHIKIIIGHPNISARRSCSMNT